MDVIRPEDLWDEDEDEDEDGGEEWRREAAHRFLKREYAVGWDAKLRSSGLIVVTGPDDNRSDDGTGFYL